MNGDVFLSRLVRIVPIFMHTLPSTDVVTLHQRRMESQKLTRYEKRKVGRWEIETINDTVNGH